MSNKQFWDLSRFFKTLTYFEIIPFIGSLKCLRKIILGEEEKYLMVPNINQTGVILLAGATGGVGKRVVKRLRELNYPVRVLVRSIERAKNILGEDLDFYEGDITIPQTLQPELMEDVAATICCTGTRVQPVEGDTPNRDKYYQGVKFYRPEIAESTPEAVEYKGIKNLVDLAATHLNKTVTATIFDFNNPSQELKDTWGAVDDVVMGGVSESNIKMFGDTALFSGNVSVVNSGGFASVRNRNFSPPLDLSTYDGFELRVRGDGKHYKFIARCEGKWDGVSYCYSFDTDKSKWITVRVAFTELIPVFRAKTLSEVDKFAADKTYAVQLMYSKFEYDGELNPTFEPGHFELEIASIKVYGGDKKPQFVMISSAGVTRPGRPGINLEEEPPAVRMNDMLGGILTWKLRGEDAVRESGLSYTIIRPCALTEEAGGKVLTFDQGDNLKGKVSREDIAELCTAAITSSNTVNKTFEVKQKDKTQTEQDWDNLWGDLSSDFD